MRRNFHRVGASLASACAAHGRQLGRHDARVCVLFRVRRVGPRPSVPPRPERALPAGQGPLSERQIEGDLCFWKDDVTVIVEAEARIVGHLPGMTVEVEERSCVAAVEGLRRLASDLGPVRARLLDDLVHVLARADIVREGDATPTGAVIRRS